MDLVDDLKAAAGTELFGVADARTYGEKAPPGHRPTEYLKDARSIVLMAVRLLDLPLDELPTTRKEYTANFHMANTRLNHALFDAAGYLQAKGHKVFPIPYLEMPGWNLDKRPAWMLKLLRHVVTLPRIHEAVNAKVLWENLSYRHMAVEAGLGEIGVNNLLLTPEHGARVRFVSLLTDAELPVGTPREAVLCQPERCGYACVKACPAEALDRDGRGTDKAACLKYYIKLGLPGMSGVRCGLCVAKCPVYRPRFREGLE
jgi:epoxyqueuosine reductase QueG